MDPFNYSLKSGSALLKLKVSYLDKLNVGSYTLRLEYKNQSVEAKPLVHI
ncbi:hypothetical protein CMETHOX_20420 [Lacrimispora indolis]|nr:hypothetical protein [Eubacterium callanderi]GFZ24119.1 hypothetical protein CMETHOX_20420 [[Clostridium] methoxybenzovorans]